jgi:hypothetical protein
MWIRVNGGDWNLNPASDLSTGAFGLTFSEPYSLSRFARPAASILSTGANQISLQSAPAFGLPAGYTFIY